MRKGVFKCWVSDELLELSHGTTKTILFVKAFVPRFSITLLVKQNYN